MKNVPGWQFSRHLGVQSELFVITSVRGQNLVGPPNLSPLLHVAKMSN